MNVPYREPVSNISTLTKRAKEALKLNKRINELTKVLEEEKVFFRDVAGGDTLNIPVAGVGEITVTKPSAASSSIVTSFDMTAFKNLPETTRAMLYQLGVVKDATVNKPEGTPSVRMTLNK
jgi:hypothetical protein